LPDSLVPAASLFSVMDDDEGGGGSPPAARSRAADDGLGDTSIERAVNALLSIGNSARPDEAEDGRRRNFMCAPGHAPPPINEGGWGGSGEMVEFVEFSFPPKMSNQQVERLPWSAYCTRRRRASHGREGGWPVMREAVQDHPGEGFSSPPRPLVH
jgi:hypothetical protein